jgi:hypothetical protein
VAGGANEQGADGILAREAGERGRVVAEPGSWTSPPDFVSVAFKGFRFSVSSLDATLMSWLGSVASEGVTAEVAPTESG